MQFEQMFVTAVCVLFLLKLKWPKSKNFYETIHERHGHDTLKTVRRYEKDLSRYNKVALDITFLQKCRLFHIYPKFLDFKLSRHDFQETRACHRFKEDLLNYELREKKSLRLKYKESYETARCLLQETLSPLELNHTCSIIETKSSKLKDRLSKKLDKKFNVLKRKKGIPQLSTLDNDSIIFNYSHRVLTETEKSVLARGLRFCLPPKNVDKYEVKSSFELLFRDLKRHGPTLTVENEDRLKCQFKKHFLQLHLFI